MEKRPVLRLPYTALEITVQLATVAVLFLAWGMAWLSEQQLPEIIPTHYNFSGEVDGYGSKKTIFAMPGIATIIAVVLALLSTVPHQFNYLVAITEVNAEKQYRRGRMLLFVVSLVVAAISLWSVWEMAHF